MKASFLGYYPPTSEQYERLWKEGLIVLDTNVLLDLYRLPTTAREELLSVLELFKGRLWIPHQVALEFQRRRLSVISTERKAPEEALLKASEQLTELKRRVESLQVDKRGLGIKAQPLIAGVEQASATLTDALKKVSEAQLDVAAVDPIRDRLDAILGGCVGVAPTSQGELDALIEGGDDRFKDRIPPGFADADKDKNPLEATFIHDHLRYQRKFGDLVLWRQLLRHTTTAGIKVVLLVTADRKEDWWWREQGKTIGPHPELAREIAREGGVELFWMYSSVQFVEHAPKYTSATVSSQSVAELEQVLLSAPGRSESSAHFIWKGSGASDSREPVSRVFMRRLRSETLREPITTWLRESGADVKVNARGFPDLLVMDGELVHGIEIKSARSSRHALFEPMIVDSLLRGYLEINEGRLATFKLVLVLSENDAIELLENDTSEAMRAQAERLLTRYPVTGVVIGAVIGERFEPLLEVHARDEQQ